MAISPLAVTMGEPAGVGGEITLAAWRQRTERQLPPFFVLDDPERLRALAAELGMDIDVVEIAGPEETADIFPHALPVLPVKLPNAVKPGTPDPANGKAVIDSIRLSIELAMTGSAGAVVTNPIHKHTLMQAGFEHPGHTEYLAAMTGASAVMMLVSPLLRVAPVTVHCALRDAADLLTTELIVDRGRIVAAALETDFGIAAPRLAIAALNPHGGEGGTFGTEEHEIIAPAVRVLCAGGIDATGPHPADSMFRKSARDDYDAALCMYHDQALIPLKTLDFEHGVNVTLGLPIVRTSPDHGTALALAGTGNASAEGLISALTTAADIARNRAARSAQVDQP